MSQADVKEIKIECPSNVLRLATQSARESIDRFKANQERASYVRKALDNKFNPAWGVVAGQDFGRYASLTVFSLHFLFIELMWPRFDKQYANKLTKLDYCWIKFDGLE